MESAGKAPFDERLALTGMLVDRTIADMKACMETADYLTELMNGLKPLKQAEGKLTALLEDLSTATKAKTEKLAAAGALSAADRKKYKRVDAFLARAIKEADSFDKIRDLFEDETDQMRSQAKLCGVQTQRVFSYVADAFAEGNEMLILVTELTVNTDAARFIASFGCEPYTRYNEQLMLSQRSGRIAEKIAALGL